MNNEYGHLPRMLQGEVHCVMIKRCLKRLAGMDHLLIRGGNDRDLLCDDNVQCPEAPASDLFNPWVKRPIQKTHLTNTVESVWNTWCETLSDTGKLPVPLGGYKLTSLKLRRLNNLTHKRLREGCVDWKSIGCPQPHTSLSQRWHQHFFKRCNRFSLQGLYSESTCKVPVHNNSLFPTKFENNFRDTSASLKLDMPFCYANH